MRYLRMIRDWVTGLYLNVEMRLFNPKLYKMLVKFTDDDLWESEK